MAYLARVSYTGNNSTVDYSIPFSYIVSSHIYAWLDNVSTTAFTVSGSTLTFTTAPGTGVAILIKRVTPTDARLVDFQDGSVLTESDLDQSADQNFYIAQESSDTAQTHLALNNSSLWDATSKRIINVADPTGTQDAVSKNYLESTWLSTSDKANLTTVAGISGNITTVAGISANVTSVAGDATDIGVVAGKATEIGRLGTADTVADMALLGTVDCVADMAQLASTAIIADLAMLADTDIVADLAQLATTDFVSDLNAIEAVKANVTTCADNLTGINNFASIYRTGSTNPVSSLDEGDLFFNTTDNALKYYNGSSWASITAGIGSLADDTTPQLGGDLDLDGNVIDFKPEEPLSNINSVGANTTTTLTSTRNYALVGEITVADTYTWDVAGTGTLNVI